VTPRKRRVFNKVSKFRPSGTRKCEKKKGGETQKNMDEFRRVPGTPATKGREKKKKETETAQRGRRVLSRAGWNLIGGHIGERGGREKEKRKLLSSIWKRTTRSASPCRILTATGNGGTKKKKEREEDLAMHAEKVEDHAHFFNNRSSKGNERGKGAELEAMDVFKTSRERRGRPRIYSSSFLSLGPMRGKESKKKIRNASAGYSRFRCPSARKKERKEKKGSPCFRLSGRKGASLGICVFRYLVKRGKKKRDVTCDGD